MVRWCVDGVSYTPIFHDSSTGVRKTNFRRPRAVGTSDAVEKTLSDGVADGSDARETSERWRSDRPLLAGIVVGGGRGGDSLC